MADTIHNVTIINLSYWRGNVWKIPPLYLFIGGEGKGDFAQLERGLGCLSPLGQNMDKRIIRGRGFVRVAGKRDGRPIFTGL